LLVLIKDYQFPLYERHGIMQSNMESVHRGILGRL